MNVVVTNTLKSGDKFKDMIAAFNYYQINIFVI